MILVGYADLVISLPVLVDEDGVINPIVLHSANGTQRQRRGCFIEISHDGQSIAKAFIIEAPTPHLDVQVVIINEID